MRHLGNRQSSTDAWWDLFRDPLAAAVGDHLPARNNLGRAWESDPWQELMSHFEEMSDESR